MAMERSGSAAALAKMSFTDKKSGRLSLGSNLGDNDPRCEQAAGVSSLVVHTLDNQVGVRSGVTCLCCPCSVKSKGPNEGQNDAIVSNLSQ